MVNENPINFAYGAASLNPHMDMPFYESHPGLVILQCLRYVQNTMELIEGVYIIR